MDVLKLKDSFTFQDLYDRSGLEKIDADFLASLDDELRHCLLDARNNPLPDESALLLELAPYLEDYLGRLFGISKEIQAIQTAAHALAPLFTCKRQFIQRRVTKSHTREEALTLDGPALEKQLEVYITPQFDDLAFAKAVLRWLEEDNAVLLETAQRYAAWRLYQETPSVLFSLPSKKVYENLISVSRETQREGFDCTTPPVSPVYALDQAHYCILCHHQGKDSCSTGLKAKDTGDVQKNPLGVSLTGCPLEEKISEMNALRTQGYTLGALAVVMIDNPMVAGTGHRICNDCMTSCIYQKQSPVDVPGIESETLQTVLRIPWGFEIYSLLSRWNPLHFGRPLPKADSGYTVLVAGLGPAGYTLAHHLLQEGHRVIGIDGLKIEPLPQTLQNLTPLRQIQDYLTPLSERIVGGFGGVAEYGITARWDKNNLTLIRLLLERRAHFLLKGGVRLGGTLTFDQAFDDYGVDHIALCLGAGKPKLLGIPGGLPRGVRMASDFLMALQLTGADKINALANLELRMPILVVGGGLTAIDTATEALAYYPLQVERFLSRYELLGPQIEETWTVEEKETAQTFITHAKALRAEREKAKKEGRPPEILKLLQSWGGATLVYRKSLQESPAYRLNHEEVSAALAQGIVILENAIPSSFLRDQWGHLSHLRLEDQDLSAGSVLLALGTQPNTQIALEEGLPLMGEAFATTHEIFLSQTPGRSISYLGDLNPHFSGSVVKAMASAKKAYPLITEMLSKVPPKKARSLEHDLTAHVVEVQRLTPTIVEVVVKAPLAARNFKPGQFFRLQNFESLAVTQNGTSLVMEGLALTGADADPEAGTVNLIVLEMGGSSTLCAHLKPGEPVVLMGPTGTPTEILQEKNVLLIGGGLGNAVLFSIGKALRRTGSKVLYVAGYKSPGDRFKREEIEAASDQVIWCCDMPSDWHPHRPQDLVFSGNVIQALAHFALDPQLKVPLTTIDHMIAIGSDRMMAAVAQARDGILKNVLSPHHTAIGSINSPMQCMLKAICAQCLQAHIHPETGEVSYVFSCAQQDQDLAFVDFQVLSERLQQNSVSEKLAAAWVGKERMRK